MKYNYLGKTGIFISDLCFGSLTLSPLQRSLSVSEGSYLIEYAYDKGINFLDTAQLYENYPYICHALRSIPREKYVIATKTYAFTKKMAQSSLEKALRELHTDYIDIFLLHEQESIHTIHGHYPAIAYLLNQKKAGKVRAVGLSTHYVAGVKGANQFDEIEIVHPLLNWKGLGIMDGSRSQMECELQNSRLLGKGIYSMKCLGGGHFVKQAKEAFAYLNQLSILDSVAVGMQTTAEIDCNLILRAGGTVPEDLFHKVGSMNRRLTIEKHCISCGNCVSRCPQNAMTMINGEIVVNDRCVLCGYCAAVCPEFCIKVI